MNTEIIKTKSKYSYSTAIRKLILAQFGAAILAIMTSLPTITITSNGTLLGIATTILALVFYFYLQYSAIWDIAAKDKLAIDGKRMTNDSKRGLKAALLANIPTYILVVLSVVFKAVHLFTDIKVVGLCFNIAYAAELFWNYMYHGLLVLIVPDAKSALSLLYFASFAILTIPSLICCFIAYKMGLKGKHIFPEKKKNN